MTFSECRRNFQGVRRRFRGAILITIIMTHGRPYLPKTLRFLSLHFGDLLRPKNSDQRNSGKRPSAKMLFGISRSVFNYELDRH